MKQAFYADYIYYGSKLYNNSWLIVNDGIVEKIEKNLDDRVCYDIREFQNAAIFPGLINTHTHLPMSIFRGMADDLPLMEWLNDYIWPAEKKYVSPEFVYNYTLLSVAESIRSGVTCVNDMYYYGSSGAKALRAAGVRGVVGFGVMGSPKEAIKAAEEFEQDELVKGALCPHALYTVGPETIAGCAEFSIKKNMLLHTHLAETENEVDIIIKKYGKRPAMLMNETGAFDCKSIFAHCVHLDNEEIEIMGKKHVNVSHCIESNLKLASGFAPIKNLIDAGANVSIGTDGASSNNDQSMINEISTVSKFHKAFNKNAQAFPAKQIIEMATLNAANGLYYNKIGSLEAGNFADFFVLSFNAVHMTPIYDPISHLVYTAQNSDVTDVYVKGKAIMKNWEILTFDEEEIKNIARKEAKIIRG